MTRIDGRKGQETRAETGTVMVECGHFASRPVVSQTTDRPTDRPMLAGLHSPGWAPIRTRLKELQDYCSQREREGEKERAEREGRREEERKGRREEERGRKGESRERESRAGGQ